MRLTDPAEIDRRVEAARPLKGAPLPKHVEERLGATHFDGKYYLTKEPFLVEGARKLHELGFGIGKFWLDHSMVGYSFNSDWPYSPPHPPAPLDQIIRHADYATAFEFPFSTIILEVGPLKVRDPAPNTVAKFDEHEREVYEVARHLFKTYGQRDVTFILQNWEGDWMLRGSFDGKWPAGVAEVEVARRVDLMIQFFSARQRAVNRARADFPAAKARVLHAVEVNKVHDAARGIPTLHTHVLPHVAVDLISWSCYDGLANAAGLWHGVEMLRQADCLDPKRRPDVFVGEIGHPEHGQTREAVREWWDVRLAVLLALNVPWIVHWELYCNEPLDGVGRHEAMVRPQEIMKGYWLLRPDGSASWSCEVLREILNRAGQ